MKFLVSSLPTKGITIPNGLIRELDINPLTYKQLVKFTNKDYINDIDKTIAEIENFITDIHHWELLSAYDLSSILFTRKYISATLNNELLLRYNGKDYSIPLDSITFKDFNEELLNIKTVDINGKTFLFKVPTIKEYLEALRAVSSVSTDEELWLNKYDVMILTALGLNQSNVRDMLYDYSNASGDDVVTIKHIDNLLNNTVNDVTIKDANGGDKVVDVNRYATDIFQLIYLNRPLNTSKIGLKSRVES